MSRGLELAERALSAAGPAGDGLVATVERERSLLLRFARSRPTQATAVDDLTVEVAALRDGHVGRASTNLSDDGALADCARGAVEAAETAARRAGTGAYPGFPSPAPARPHHGHDPDTALLDAERGAGALSAASAAAGREGVEANGAWTAAEVERTVASSSGRSAEERLTDSFMKVVCIARGGRSGFASQTAVAAAELDPERVARSAARKAAVSGEPVTVEAGELPTVLEPAAVCELLLQLAPVAFGGLAHVEGRGAMVDRLGTRVAAPSINLSDSPFFAGTLPRAFDAEGVGKRPLPLIQDGIGHAVVHDTRSAALAGTTSTGHALATGGGPAGPEPTNLVLLGGAAEGVEELCRPIERGVYVTRLWYGNVVRPRDALVTAVTRDGTFLIEDGEIGPPINDLRLTDNVLEVLARTEALGARPELVSDGEFYGRRFASGVVCPPLRAGAVRFTGQAG